MPSLVIPSTLQVGLIWQLDGADHAVNVFHFILPVGAVVDQALADEVASKFGLAWQAGATTYRDRVANDFSMARVELRDIRTANNAIVSGFINSPGLNVADPLPLQTALVVTLRTAKAGRSFRGRVYTLGWGEASSDSKGQPTVQVRAAAENFVGALQNVSTSEGTLQLAVASRARTESNAVVSADVRDLVWDTQRRRSYPGI